MTLDSKVHSHPFIRFITVGTKDMSHHRGTYKVRNEIETERNQRKRNETKRNQRKRNETKRNETKRNQRNGNEMKRNQRKQNEID